MGFALRRLLVTILQSRSLFLWPNGRRGRPGNSRCALVSRHGALPSLVGKPGLPRKRYRNGARPAEMPIGYHRDVCAASRTEAPSDLIRARFASQTFAGKAL